MSMKDFILRHLIPLFPETHDYPKFLKDTTMPKTTTKLPGDTEHELVLFRSSSWDGFYVYSPNLDHSFQLTNKYPCLKWIDHHSYDFVDIPTDIDLEDWDHIYMCANCDCAFPPKYLVSAQNESDAISEFISTTNACLITETDAADYKDADGEWKEEVDWDDNGRPNDTSQIIVVKLFPILTLSNLVPINHFYVEDAE